jgi:DNA-binding HxlR family transcriptional regulator
MAEGSYNQFCPVAMAAEILCTRWTVIVLRELIAGSTRFNELRRGVPRMSPALLSKRLKDLEAAGIVMRSKLPGDPDVYEYTLTAAGKELRPVIESVGGWGHRWVTTEASLDNLDPNLLMWDMRRNIKQKSLPKRRSTIQVIFSDLPEAKRNWWLIAQPGEGIDLCSVDPGFDVDLYLVTNLHTMTEIWMGYTTVARAKKDESLVVTGNRQLEVDLQTWLGLSPFAKGEKLVA